MITYRKRKQNKTNYKTWFPINSMLKDEIEKKKNLSQLGLTFNIKQIEMNYKSQFLINSMLKNKIKK